MSEQCIVPHVWGRERVLEENDSYVLKILEVDPGCQLSLEYHDRQRLTLYSLYGHGVLFMANEDSGSELNLLPGRYWTVEPGVVHRLTASASSMCAVMQVSCPIEDDTTILEEAQRFYDPYGH